jgi:hypothetical protein
VQRILDLTLEHIRFLKAQVTQAEQWVSSELQAHPQISQLATIPGVGPVVSGGNGAEIGVSDEASGAPLARYLHVLKTKGDRKGLTMRDVQSDLRLVFTQWGLPDALRMDRDSLFVGSCRLEWPGTLLLWLVGLGVQPIINRAFRPTDNAMVERSHRTWKNDVLVGSRFVDLLALQARSDQALEDRRCYLPSRHKGCNYRPPAQAYPDLMIPRRRYPTSQERMSFDLQRVDAYLS